MKCTNCGHKMEEKRVTRRFDESGLSHVTLVNVPEYHCPECGEVELVLPRLPELHRLLAEMLTYKKAPLAPEEFRYLRKHLGLSSTDFARRIGVSLESVSRWESGKHPIDPPADRLVRLMVATSKPVDRYPEEIFPETATGSKKAAAPAKFRFEAPSRPTSGWAMAATG